MKCLFTTKFGNKRYDSVGHHAICLINLFAKYKKKNICSDYMHACMVILPGCV